jgi:rhodanese-related sulfurtransferase
MDSIRMSPEEINARALAGEKIIFLDSRNPTAWAESDYQIPGAIRMPVDEVEHRSTELDKDATIAAYCT